MWKSFFQLFYADTCHGCDRMLTSQERYICLRCLSQLQETQDWLRPTDNELYHRIGGRFHLHGAASLYHFDKGGRFQALMKQLKYHEAPQLGTHLGQVAGDILLESRWFSRSTVIVPVPLHPAKMRNRGYNQAACIAGGMALKMGMRVEPNLIRRLRKTSVQAQQGALNRWDNMRNAFTLKGHPPKEVLLVDDVITTGSTILGCVECLMNASLPPTRISVFSLGMARTD
ncbi:hypothetical protein [Pontibacter sp. G13]|uniref:ComF family protein n=1 Tax=Pontibacter sp. G13 TaxID=3074898 RepID=UPI00288B6A65|nr:hypothetical protein [Pontibacter sp. G13]WNJ20241.1 hypothetical protein RJD25_07155 [Pontibacter sp. G13]